MLVRHIAFTEKIPKIQCMSSKLIVKHPKCCGPSLCRPKNRRRRSRFLPPRSIPQNSGGGCLDGRNQKEVSGAALYFMEFLFQHLDLAGCGILSISTGRTKMPDEAPPPTRDTELTTNIVAAYVRRNQITSDQPWMLISTVHQALTSHGKPVAELDRARIPAVPIQ